MATLPLGCTSARDASGRGEGELEQRSPTVESVVEDWNPWRVSPTPSVVIGESEGVEYALAGVGDALRYSSSAASWLTGSPALGAQVVATSSS